MTDKRGMITLLDVSQRPFRPVTVILEDGGLESVEWLVERAEKILTKLADAGVKVRVKVLVVGDMEIKRENWRDRSINHYRLLGDPWFITTLQAPNFPAGETVSQTIVYTSPLQHSISVCSGLDSVGNIHYGNGIVEFTDFADKNLERREWSSKAPKWRKADPGLCVEGKCTSMNCEANGSMVIVNMGFCSFSLPEDVYKCQCPLCSKSVTPVTCAFNNCRWKWAGSKYEPLPNPPTKYSGKWKVADNAYHQFKPNNSGGGKAQWLTLTIYTEDSRKEPIVCNLCNVYSSTGINTYQCGHSLHKKCVSSFPLIREKVSNYCPQCFMNEIESL